MKLTEWLKERELNARRIAANKTGADRAGWLEDAGYFKAALEALAAPAPQPCDYPDCKCPTESPCLQGRPIAAPKTQAPSVADRKPLTEQQAMDLWCKRPVCHQFVEAYMAGLRDGERAHGITAPDGVQGVGAA